MQPPPPKKAFLNDDLYADDTSLYSTRRKTTRDIQETNFAINVKRGGDPNSVVGGEREFEPWFLETGTDGRIAIDIDEVKRKKRCMYRLKYLTIRIFASAIYDYIYLLSFLSFAIAVPISNRPTRLVDPIYELDERVIPLTLLAMCLSAVVPVIGAIFIRLFLINFSRKEITETSVRFWGCFFFVTLKITEFSISDLFFFLPGFVKRRIGRCLAFLKRRLCNVKIKDSSRVTEVIEQFGLPAIEKLELEATENDKSKVFASTLINNSSSTPTDSEFDLTILGGADEETFTVAGNEMAWNCRVCNEFNLQQNHAHMHKTLAETRKGTKENASNVKIIVRTVGAARDHHVVEFKHHPDGNECRKCGTAWDYKPRKCNDERFYGFNDYLEQLHPGKTRSGSVFSFINGLGFDDADDDDADDCAADADVPPATANTKKTWAATPKKDKVKRKKSSIKSKVSKSKSKLNLPSTATATATPTTPSKSSSKVQNKLILLSKTSEKSLPQVWTSFNISLLQKLSVTQHRVKVRYHSFLDAVPLSEQALGNDYTFKERLKAFMPFVPRRKLPVGAKYSIGDKIESVERKPHWCPGTITRAGTNGTYDLVFDTGEKVETVLPQKIRYRPTYHLSLVARLVLLECVVGGIVTPLAGYNLYHQANTGETEDDTDNSINVLVAFLLYNVFTTVAIALKFATIYVKNARSGVIFHLKLLIYYLLPNITGLTFTSIIIAKMRGNELLYWYSASIAQFLFSISVSTQWKQINPFFGACCYVLTVPLTVFSFATTVTLDTFLDLDEEPMQLWGPFILFAALLVVVRGFVPYVRSPEY